MGFPECSPGTPCNKDISLVIAGLLGTILALVYSLAIVGVQIASINYSRTVLHMFFRDHKAQISVLITFSLIIISLFLSNISQLPLWGFVKGAHIFYFQIILVGLAVDAVHYFFKRIIAIHDPILTLNSLLCDLRKSIKKSDQYIRKFGRKLRKNSKEKDESRIDGYDSDSASAYMLAPDFDNNVNYYIKSILEIGHKALPRNDYSTITASVNTVVEIVNEFIKVRKDTIFVVPDPNFLMMSSRTSVDGVITGVCEELMILNREAIRQEKENICIKIVLAFWQIIHLCLQTKIKSSKYDTNALVSMPLSYIKNCVLESQRSKMMEVPWEFIRHIPNIINSADDNIQSTKLYLSISDTTDKVILEAYKNQHEVVAKQAMVNLLQLLSKLLEKKYWQLEETTEDFIKKISFYFDFHKILEAANPMGMLMGNAFPLFDTMSDYSLQNLCRKSQCLIEEYDAEKSWVNPYYNFNKFNKILSDCYRDICYNHSPGKSFTMHGIVHGLRHITKVFYCILDDAEKSEGKKRYIDEILSQLKYYIWSLTFIKEVNGKYARDCGNLLGISAMQYAEKGYTDISIEICKTLIAVSTAAYKLADYKVNAVSGIFYSIWCIEKYLNEKESISVANTIKSLYTTKPKEISDEHWSKILLEIDNFPKDFSGECNNYSSNILQTAKSWLIDWMKSKSNNQQ